jgi:hypothetical protein
LQQQALLAVGGGAVHQNAARLQVGHWLAVSRQKRKGRFSRTPHAVQTIPVQTQIMSMGQCLAQLNGSEGWRQKISKSTAHSCTGCAMNGLKHTQALPNNLTI